MDVLWCLIESFMLETILEAVREFPATGQESDHVTDQVACLLAELRDRYNDFDFT